MSDAPDKPPWPWRTSEFILPFYCRYCGSPNSQGGWAMGYYSDAGQACQPCFEAGEERGDPERVMFWGWSHPFTGIIGVEVSNAEAGK